MPVFSQTSMARLSTCHNDLQVLAKALIQDYDCTVVCGHRTQEDQQRAYDKGNSQLLWPHSKHNTTPSIAIDLAPYVDGIPWADDHAFYLFAGKVLERARFLHEVGLMEYRLRGGADWDGDQLTADHSLRDPGHFELVIE